MGSIGKDLLYGGDVALRQGVGGHHHDPSGGLGDLKDHRSILRGGEFGHPDVRRDGDREGYSGCEVLEVIGEAVVVLVYERIPLLRPFGIEHHLVLLDDPRVHGEDERIELDPLVELVLELGGELHDLPVEVRFEEPVPADLAVRRDIAEDGGEGLADLLPEGDPDDPPAYKEPRFVFHDAGLSALDAQVPGVSVAHVLHLYSELEGLVGVDLLGQVVVEEELGLRMDGDLHRFGLGLNELSAHEVIENRFDVVLLPLLRILPPEPIARNELPAGGHGGERREALRAVHGRYARELGRGEVEHGGHIPPLLIRDPNLDPEGVHGGAGVAVGELEPAIEGLALKHRLLRDVYLHDLEDLLTLLSGKPSELGKLGKAELSFPSLFGGHHYPLLSGGKPELHLLLCGVGDEEPFLDPALPGEEGVGIEIGVGGVNLEVSFSGDLIGQVRVLSFVHPEGHGHGALRRDRSDVAPAGYLYARGIDRLHPHIVKLHEAWVHQGEVIGVGLPHLLRDGHPGRDEGHLGLGKPRLEGYMQGDLVDIGDLGRGDRPLHEDGEEGKLDLYDLRLAQGLHPNRSGDLLVSRSRHGVIVFSCGGVLQSGHSVLIGLQDEVLVVDPLLSGDGSGYKRGSAHKPYLGSGHRLPGVVYHHEGDGASRGRAHLHHQGHVGGGPVAYSYPIDVSSQRNILGRRDRHLKLHALSGSKLRLGKLSDRDPGEKPGRDHSHIPHRSEAFIGDLYLPRHRLSGIEAHPELLGLEYENGDGGAEPKLDVSRGHKLLPAPGILRADLEEVISFVGSVFGDIEAQVYHGLGPGGEDLGHI